MSHFVYLETHFFDWVTLRKAITEAGYAFVEGPIEIRAGHKRETVSLAIRDVRGRYDIGFKQAEGNSILAVGELQDRQLKDIVNKVKQRYAYNVVCIKLQEQGFRVDEEREEEGQLHMVLRRMA